MKKWYVIHKDGESFISSCKKYIPEDADQVWQLDIPFDNWSDYDKKRLLEAFREKRKAFPKARAVEFDVGQNFHFISYRAYQR